ncbi:hypothetical protein [Acidisphaera sp. S103]|uniref:hypothetical protein n=1 Tax=Acidisphaera sp. S103 TaxID=1747223 RepID=UPI00131C1204|nr:hypothetical protein [Acidisphaera sp. S103]
MSLAALFPAAVLETILLRLAPLFLAGAGDDLTAARHAAAQTLGSYRPETEDELRLAVNIIAFGLHALEALGQAAAPDLPVTRVLRLRGNAVSLSRESAKAQRSLDQLQKARRQNRPAEPVEPRPAPADQKVAIIPGPIRHTDGIAAVTAIRPARTETEEDRQRDIRIAGYMQRPVFQAAAQAKAALQGAFPA